MDMMGLAWVIHGLGLNGVLYYYFYLSLFLFHLLSVYNISSSLSVP